MLRKLKILISLFVGMLLLATSCSNLDNPVGDSLQMDLKTETKWSVGVETGNKINKIHYKEYDTHGNIILNINYFGNGEINCRSIFEYTGKDSSIEEKTTYDPTGNIVNETTTNYIYNDYGKIKKSIRYNGNGEITNVYLYEYDTQGNLLKKTSTLNNDSILAVEYSYRYNQNGNVIERVLNDSGTSSDNMRDSVIYSSQNEINIFKYENNHLSSVTSYLYNNNGLIYQEIVSDSKGKIVEKYVYEYTFY